MPLRPDVSLGLPEIRLGLLPGSGGTQRLPRLIGAAPALERMLSGDPIDLERAGALGIIDGESGGEELLEHACRFAREAAGVELDGRRLCNRVVPGGAPLRCSRACIGSAKRRAGTIGRPHRSSRSSAAAGYF